VVAKTNVKSEKEGTMHRRHGVRTHSRRQGSSSGHHVQVIVVANDRTIEYDLPTFVTRMVRRGARRDAVPDAPPIALPPCPLSAREREVLEMIAQGMRDKEIANLLFITDRTVKFHAQAIYRKLAVTNRTEAVSVALRRGIVALDPPVSSVRDAG
jgi:DNA-binding NarL/FixJ family response regulator